MDARETTLFGLLDGSKHYVIPNYQRLYSWEGKHCEKLFLDIEQIALGKKSKHFVGSIVYVSHTARADGINEFVVIDGQQRLTTISLLLLAVIDAMGLDDDEFKRRINRTIRNGDEKPDSNQHLKLRLTRTDNDSYKSIVHAVSQSESLHNDDSKVFRNFVILKNLLAESKASALQVWDAITQLDMVYIALESGKDDPQAIFESLNSTGKSLSPTDLIRNFVLMDQTDSVQTELYENYWAKIEELFRDRKDTEFEEFTRANLTAQQKKYPAVTEVYEQFQSEVRKSYEQGQTPHLVLGRFRNAARSYANVHWMPNVSDARVKQALMDYRALRLKVLHPLLLKYAKFEVPDEEFDPRLFESGLQLLESFLVRRSFVGLKSNSLDNTVAKIYDYMEKSKFQNIEAVADALLSLRGKSRFPLDDEVIYRGQTMELYNSANKDHILRKLERYLDPKGLGMSARLSVEHVMPQKLTRAWTEMLGADANQVRERLVHTIGNLTLTPYNSELGNRSFAEKKNVKEGFANSKIKLSESIVSHEVWTDKEILARGEMMMKLAVQAWPLPHIWNPSYERIEADEPIDEITLLDLILEEVLQPNDELYWKRSDSTYVARVTENGTVVVQDGDEYETLGAAIKHFTNSSYNAWKQWRHLSEDGRTLDELRQEMAKSQNA